jgi:hypothetical protein
MPSMVSFRCSCTLFQEREIKTFGNCTRRNTPTEMKARSMKHGAVTQTRKGMLRDYDDAGRRLAAEDGAQHERGPKDGTARVDGTLRAHWRG